MSRHRNGLVSLTEQNLILLKRANYILHCAINSCLIGYVFLLLVDLIFLSFSCSILDLRLGASCNWQWSNVVEDQTQTSPVSWCKNMLPVVRYVFVFPCLRCKGFANMLCLVFPIHKNSRLDHLCIDQAKRLNPLQHSTYDDEDYVGKIKKLCLLAPPSKMALHVLERYTSYVCTRWLRVHQWYGCGWTLKQKSHFFEKRCVS